MVLGVIPDPATYYWGAQPPGIYIHKGDKEWHEWEITIWDGKTKEEVGWQAREQIKSLAENAHNNWLYRTAATHRGSNA